MPFLPPPCGLPPPHIPHVSARLFDCWHCADPSLSFCARSSKYALLVVSPSDLKRCQVAGSTVAATERATTPRAAARRSPHALPCDIECDIECDVLVAGGYDIVARCVPGQLLVRFLAGLKPASPLARFLSVLGLGCAPHPETRLQMHTQRRGSGRLVG
eukprot:366551-Chlamydomonas_euryale.AAC.45